MRSIKPGRGPSAMGVVSSVAATIFGVFWTIMASSMGAPIFFPLFGLVFIGIGIMNIIYNYKNATGKNRFSIYDITEGDEEPDPFDPNFSEKADVKRDNFTQSRSSSKVNFCPYCGTKLEEGFEFCQNCGKKLPK